MIGGLVLAARRLAAYAIDVAVLFAVLGGAQLALSRLAGFPSWEAFGHSPLLLEAWVALTISLPSWSYFTLADSSGRGVTLGKGLMRLRVATTHGMAPRTPQALVRTAVKLVPWELSHLAVLLPAPIFVSGGPTVWQTTGLIIADAAVLAYLGVLVATRGRRSVHDMVAGTRVCESASGRQGQVVPSS